MNIFHLSQMSIKITITTKLQQIPRNNIYSNWKEDTNLMQAMVI